MTWVRRFLPWELSICEWLGREKSALHAGHNWTVGPDEPRYQRLGHMSEWAWAEWLAMPRKRVFQIFPRSDGGEIDNFYPATGQTVQIKATTHPRGNLIFPLESPLTADLVLFTREFGSDGVQAAGWLPLDEWHFLRDERDLGNGKKPVWFVYQDRLWPVQSLPGALISMGKTGTDALGAPALTSRDPHHSDRDVMDAEEASWARFRKRQKCATPL